MRSDRGKAFEHVVQFYDDDDVICGAVTDFLLEGQSLGEFPVLLSTAARRPKIARRLRARGFDFDASCRRGDAVFVDARELLDSILVDGEPHAERFDDAMRSLLLPAQDGTRRIRIFGELVDLLSRADNHEGAVALEDLWHQLARTREFRLFCAYHVGNLYREVNGSAYRDICDRHSRVIPAES